MNTKDIRRPLIPHNLIVDNKSTYLNCIKRRYKHIHSLKMEYIPMNKRNKCHLKPMRHYLTKLAKNLKHNWSLCLQKYIFCARDFFGKEIFYITKLFSKVQYLSLPILTHPQGQLKSNINWLRQLKFLKGLRCVNEKSASWIHHKRSILEIFRKFSRTLKIKKLESLDLTLNREVIQDVGSLAFVNPIPSVKKLNLKLDELYEGFSTKDCSFLANMKQLTELYLSIPAPLTKIVRVLSLFPLLGELKGLGFMINNAREADFQELEKIMQGCKALDQVSLKFDVLPATANLLAFESLSKCPLKKFSLEAQIEGQNGIIMLGHLIRNLSQLEELSLKLDWPSFLKSDSAGDFFDNMTSLVHLKKLELYFAPHEIQKHGGGSLSLLLKRTLKKLSNLEELNLGLAELGIANQLSNIASGLDKNINKIRKLKICLYREKLQKAELDKFLQTLKQFKSLQTLVLDELFFAYDEIEATVFVNMFSQLKDLKVLKFERLTLTTHRIFAFMINKLLYLEGLKELECADSGNSGWGHHAPMTRVTKEMTKVRNIVVPWSLLPYFTDVHVLTWN